MTMMKFGIGQPVKRVEDQKFLTGAGRYSADIAPDGALAGIVLRSPHAKARIAGIDPSAAQTMPGVKLVLIAKDIANIGGLPCLAPLPGWDGKPMATPPYPVLAVDAVRHVGDAVAFVVAETDAQARDAAEAIVVDYDGETPAIDMRAAVEKGAPLVWPDFGTNVAVDTGMGSKDEVDAIFAGAAHRVELDIVNNRVVANYMEPRAAIGEFDAATGRYTLTASSQGVHGLKGNLSRMMGIEPDKLRVLAFDVGGGFGSKIFTYREHALVLEAARRCGHPVRWVSDRTEHFLADTQGRDSLIHAEMALDKDGRFLAMRIDSLANVGAYLSQFGPYIPFLTVTMATGCYDIPKYYGRVRDIYTNTQPVDAYRGAGRPEAAYMIERLVDACAIQLGIPPAEMRARNFVKASQMPYKTQTNRTYDVGDFEGAMRQALRKADADGFETRRAAARKEGRALGLGVASYIECTAWGAGEDGSVALDEDGGFTVLVGTQSNGQGHATAYAQIVSEYLNVDPAQVRVVQGDSDALPTGGGTSGSRSIPVGGVMVSRGSEALATSLRKLAADKLEAATNDLEFADGGVRVAGTDRRLSFAELAALPGATADARTGKGSFAPPEPTYPNGTHVCELAVDTETGEVEIRRYTVCDDFGMTLNPILLQGQVHGGIVQGIGQALMEETVFSPEGQLLTASLMDYRLPRAGDVPNFSFETRNIPSTTNPLGLKGAGEAGSIGSCPAVMNALVDALRHACGVTNIDMPATPSRIHAAIAGAQGAGAG
jgi:carbon-monoxide dehydrogenase large subunit